MRRWWSLSEIWWVLGREQSGKVLWNRKDLNMLQRRNGGRGPQAPERAGVAPGLRCPLEGNVVESVGR